MKAIPLTNLLPDGFDPVRVAQTEIDNREVGFGTGNVFESRAGVLGFPAHE